MSCLVAERCGPVRMTAVRAALVRRLAECFGCDRYHLYTGHPLLRASRNIVGCVRRGTHRHVVRCSRFARRVRMFVMSIR